MKFFVDLILSLFSKSLKPSLLLTQKQSETVVETPKFENSVEKQESKIEVKSMLTLENLKALGVKEPYLSRYLDPLNKTLEKYRINTPLRISIFFSQILHESGMLRYSEELADGLAYEPPKPLAKTLGNTEIGDGKKFKGRGIIQITGRSNYMKYGKSLGIDLTVDPSIVAKPDLSCDSAGWYWTTKVVAGKDLNTYADQDDFLRITYYVNGGGNGIVDRFKILKLAYKEFGVSDLESRVTKVKDYLKQNIGNLNRDKMGAAFFKVIFNEAELLKL